MVTQQKKTDSRTANRRKEILRQATVPVLSLIFGLVAFVLTIQYWSERENKLDREWQKLEAGREDVDIIVPDKNIPKGATLRLEDLKQRTFYRTQVGERAVEVGQHLSIVGRKTVYPISTGEPVFWNDIEGGRTLSETFSDDIREGMRAVSINVGGSAAVSGLVSPMDRVDVLGTFTLPVAGTDQLETITKTLLQDVTVLATGDTTAKSRNARRRSGYNMVTLQVTPREAEWLTFTQQLKGRLTLSLRNPSDDDYETELPRIDFNKIEGTLEDLNRHRQTIIRGRQWEED